MAHWSSIMPHEKWQLHSRNDGSLIRTDHYFLDGYPRSEARMCHTRSLMQLSVTLQGNVSHSQHLRLSQHLSTHDVIRGKSLLWCNVERKYFHEDFPLSLYAARTRGSRISGVSVNTDQWWMMRWGHVTRHDNLLLVWRETRGCTGCSQWPHCPVASVTPSLSQGQLR